MKHLILAALASTALIPAASAQTPAAAPASAEAIRKHDTQAEQEWYYSVGIQNYVFTLPLTIVEREESCGSIRSRWKRRRRSRLRPRSIRSATC